MVVVVVIVAVVPQPFSGRAPPCRQGSADFSFFHNPHNQLLHRCVLLHSEDQIHSMESVEALIFKHNSYQQIIRNNSSILFDFIQDSGEP